MRLVAGVVQSLTIAALQERLLVLATLEELLQRELVLREPRPAARGPRHVVAGRGPPSPGGGYSRKLVPVAHRWGR